MFVLSLLDRFRPAPPLRIAKAFYVCLSIVISVELVRRSIPMYLPRDWASAHEYDAIEDWKAARLFFSNISPYSKEGLAQIGQSAMGHPPTTPFWYLPLAEFPKEVAAQLSTFLVWFLLPVHTYLCCRALKFPVPAITALLTASALFATHFVKYHCDATQFSEPIAVLYVAAWWFLRRGQDARAGIALGAALTMKLFPGLMLVMLLLAKRYRAFCSATLTYLAVAVLMTEKFGLRSWYEFFHQQGPVSDQWLGSIDNSSLPGLVMQLITPACVGQTHPSKGTTLIIVACSLSLVAAAAWLCRSRFRAARECDAREVDLPFALFALVSVFCNSWVWDHYSVLAVQPLFIVTAALCGTAWRTLRGWCEEACSTRQLIRIGVASALGALGLIVSLTALSVDSHQRDEMLRLWQSSHLPFYHRLLHLLQVANFATWIVPISMCCLALSLAESRYDGNAGRTSG